MGTLLFDNSRYSFPGNWLNVSGIGHLWISHNGGWVRVHQDYPVTFLFEGFTGLSTGIVKLTGLTNDNGSGAENKYAFDIVPFRHG
jgi:hypothetical protein